MFYESYEDIKNAFKMQLENGMYNRLTIDINGSQVNAAPFLATTISTIQETLLCVGVTDFFGTGYLDFVYYSPEYNLYLIAIDNFSHNKIIKNLNS